MLRVWEQAGFRLEMFDTGTTDRLAYRFFDNGTLIFEGDDFHASPLHAIDGDATVAGLLAFLSLRPGDTDPDYFADYTSEQMAWCRRRAEYLSLIQCEMEEAAR